MLFKRIMKILSPLPYLLILGFFGTCSVVSYQEAITHKEELSERHKLKQEAKNLFYKNCLPKHEEYYCTYLWANSDHAQIEEYKKTQKKD